MNDLISRQAAIDAVIAEGRNVDSRYLESERIIHEADAVEAISMLPSAQPEIIRCKDCKYWQDNNDGYPHEDCRWGHDETPDGEDFCSYAERREE